MGTLLVDPPLDIRSNEISYTEQGENTPSYITCTYKNELIFTNQIANFLLSLFQQVRLNSKVIMAHQLTIFIFYFIYPFLKNERKIVARRFYEFRQLHFTAFTKFCQLSDKLKKHFKKGRKRNTINNKFQLDSLKQLNLECLDKIIF